jgi:hypothetical protein
MKKPYPVRIPPCPGCGNPESCGACYARLSKTDRQKLRAGRYPERRSAVSEAPGARRGAVSSPFDGVPVVPRSWGDPHVE